MEKQKRKYDKTDSFGYQGFNFMKIIGAWMTGQEIRLSKLHDFTIRVLKLEKKDGSANEAFSFEGTITLSIPDYIGSSKFRKVTESFKGNYNTGIGLGHISYKIPYSRGTRPRLGFKKRASK